MNGFESIPKPISQILFSLQDRIKSLTRQYKSLANYGRPYVEDIKEIAVIYYLNAKLGIGLNELADRIGVDKSSLYKLVKRVESEHRVAITNPQTKKVEVVEVTPEQLVNIVESEVLQISARQRIADPFMSSIIKEFWEKPILRQSNIDRRAYYNEKKNYRQLT
jgi:hypothetical protein